MEAGGQACLTAADNDDVEWVGPRWQPHPEVGVAAVVPQHVAFSADSRKRVANALLGLQTAPAFFGV